MTKRSHGDGAIDERGENTYRLRYRVNGRRSSNQRQQQRHDISNVDENGEDHKRLLKLFVADRERTNREGEIGKMPGKRDPARRMAVQRHMLRRADADSGDLHAEKPVPLPVEARAQIDR